MKKKDLQIVDAKRKFRGAVYATLAIQELRRRLACRVKHSTVFASSSKLRQTVGEIEFDPKRKFRAAVYVVIASNEIKHWIDSEDTLLHDPSLHPHARNISKPRSVGEKFNPRRTFKAAVYAIIFVKELEYWWLDFNPEKVGLLPGKVRDQVELRSHVKELLGWLGQHPTRPTFVYDFYRDQDVIHQTNQTSSDDWLLDCVPSSNPRRTIKSAVYAVMAVNKMNKNHRHEKLDIQVKDRLHWLSQSLSTKAAPKHPHFVHFEDPRDIATISTIHQNAKGFNAKRKALGDTVFVRRAGMLPDHDFHRSCSTE
ncbi:pericentrin-AKAP450 domain of centrosomal targeting protein [Nitzschia inconspicua]|uniref:Pericentrin-AKAP450 domain of centrosomal targeting protein n=1 Tax=Nitzschia inconspicua TaxID=303405 RepID=A0A9K3KXP6_9STRA|nr:pericentrin-AKAP450 domain of centrosomal targeting protein [Nitzschia inconspicua]